MTTPFLHGEGPSLKEKAGRSRIVSDGAEKDALYDTSINRNGANLDSYTFDDRLKKPALVNFKSTPGILWQNESGAPVAMDISDSADVQDEEVMDISQPLPTLTADSADVRDEERMDISQPLPTLTADSADVRDEEEMDISQPPPTPKADSADVRDEAIRSQSNSMPEAKFLANGNVKEKVKIWRQKKKSSGRWTTFVPYPTDDKPEATNIRETDLGGGKDI